jgi:hypothetical protein
MKKLLGLTLASLLLMVLVGCEGEVTLVAPENFTIAAGTNELDVVLDWDEVDEEIDGYIIYFNSAAAGTTTTAGFTHADPEESGTYYVTAYSGEDESDPSTSESTEPVVNTNIELYEIGGSGESGYGWSTTSGQGAIFSMADASNAAEIDLYFTDFATGYAGTYNIASPAETQNDAGAAWLHGTSGWRVSGFVELTENFDDVTTVPTTGYSNFEPVAQDFTYAVYTEDGHYAIVEVQSINTSTGLVQVRTAFQTVPNLAILDN